MDQKSMNQKMVVPNSVPDGSVPFLALSTARFTFIFVLLSLLLELVYFLNINELISNELYYVI